MIKEFEFFHGVVFSKILHFSNGNISIRQYPNSDNASYVIDNDVGIYIKYCSKRLTPWRFSFLKRHQDQILEMKNRFKKVFIILVCNNDGIVTLSFDEMKIILDHSHEETEWICISRKKREKYSVSGSDGKLKFKIGANDFPRKIL